VRVDEELAARAAATGGRAADAVELSRRLADQVPLPGYGATDERWAVLASLGAGDLSAARIAEAHLDALAIMAEAGSPAPIDSGVWGVYAAEGPGVKVEAKRSSTGWELTGTKPWCSAASLLDSALVTAHTDDGRRLFAIDLHDPGAGTEPGTWVSRGLAEVVSSSITLDHVPATPIGETGWYLSRPGFAWGGMGVAACWLGGVIGLARSLWTAGRRKEPDQIACLLLGTTDLTIQSALAVLADAARQVDAGQADGTAGVVLAERVRGVVAEAVDRVVEAIGHGLGPAPLATDEDHARRVADLQIYVRQHHAERDRARLGKLLLAEDSTPW
jgi:alkylation response protein AidB-like acyl-CoA dehydrogenase